MIHFRQSLYTEEHDFDQPQHLLHPAPAAEVWGMELRLNNVLVRQNNTPAPAPFPGWAKLYFLCLVAAPKGGLHLQLKGFEKVESGDALHVDKTAYSWRRERANDVAPGQVHLFAAIIKSRQPLRDAASVLSEVQRDSSYKLLQGTLENVLKSNTPADVSNLMPNLAGLVGRYLGKVDEKPLFSLALSFTGINPEAALPGKWEKVAANQFASIGISFTLKDRVRVGEEALLERTDRRPIATSQELFG